MLIIPRVTINGGNPPQLMRAPLTMPQPAPTASARRSATGSGWPACSAVPSTTPESATIDPTERSIPPERMTNVIPTATIALMLVCCATLSPDTEATTAMSAVHMAMRIWRCRRGSVTSSAVSVRSVSAAVVGATVDTAGSVRNSVRDGTVLK